MGNEASKGGGGGPGPGMPPGTPASTPNINNVSNSSPSGTRPQLKPPPRDPLYHSTYKFHNNYNLSILYIIFKYLDYY